MSLIGAPPKDLCVTSLTVQNTVSASQVTSLNVDTVSINDLSQTILLSQIRRVFDNQSVGQIVYKNGYETLIINGQLNGSGNMAPAGTVLAYVEDYLPEPFSFPIFIYCNNAPTIATAGILATGTIGDTGEISVSVDLFSPDYGGENCTRCCTRPRPKPK